MILTRRNKGGSNETHRMMQTNEMASNGSMLFSNSKDVVDRFAQTRRVLTTCQCCAPAHLISSATVFADVEDGRIVGKQWEKMESLRSFDPGTTTTTTMLCVEHTHMRNFPFASRHLWRAHIWIYIVAGGICAFCNVFVTFLLWKKLK